MWEWINESLMMFRSCFSRKASFHWFVVTIVGLMLRSDNLGVTSIIRQLWILPSYYESLLHFFRAKSWNTASIRRKWIQLVQKSNVLFYENHRPILIGDGVKQSKEGRKMPCVKKLFQESENSANPNYMFGHMFGALGVLIGDAQKMFCVPLSMTIQDGDRIIRRWLKSDLTEESHVVRLIREACCAAAIIKPSILLLDRYFLTVPALQAWIQEEECLGHSLLTIVTKAKSNAVAYEKPTPKSGRGRPPVKGASVKLKDLFQSQASLFTDTTVCMYGEMKPVRYLCKDLLWGKKLYKELRFVLVKYGTTESILVCTDTSFSPEQIIRLYSYRFKIECCFREFKQVIAGFSYHFWSKAMPKLNKFLPTNSTEEKLNAVTDESAQKQILSAFKAIEGFVMFSCIAIGLLQICSFRFADEITRSPLRWLRTVSNKIPSEATTADFMRKSFFALFYLKPDLDIVRFIRSVQSLSKCSSDSNSA